MLFNSLEFIFIFLPATWLGFRVLARHSPLAAAWWLALMSLVFYAQTAVGDLAILMPSIGFNFLAGLAIRRLNDSRSRAAARHVLIASIAANLWLLGVFKYADFSVHAVNQIAGLGLVEPHLRLPLGISFFTFTQIAYLVDVYRNVARESNPAHYVLFVSYFPHLIAGPLLHHRPMMGQFASPATYRLRWQHVAVGATIFACGLFKKVAIADNLAPYADVVFDAAEGGTRLSFAEAWLGALAYTLQIYFDFSGYSDMAIGLARLFGTRMPLNFWSPYKALNIVEFWRRWHITLSKFLRDYLYISLGGNRRGPARRYANLMVTMLLGGLWHGAGWTYVIWGGLHGFYLVANHAWRHVCPAAIRALPGYWLAAWALTFLSVVVAWVVFRAHSVDGAGEIYRAMLGLNGVMREGGSLGRFTWNGLILPNWREGIAWIAAAGALAVAAPNLMEVMRRYRPALDAWPSATRLTWRARAADATVVAGLATVAIGLVALGRPSAFLYFQF